MNQFFCFFQFPSKTVWSRVRKTMSRFILLKTQCWGEKNFKKKKIVLYFLIFMYINSICSIQHCYWRNVNLLCTRIAHLNGQYHEIFEPFYILFLHLKNSLKQLCWWLRFHVGTLELGWNSVYCKWPKLLYRLKLKRTEKNCWNLAHSSTAPCLSLLIDPLLLQYQKNIIEEVTYLCAQISEMGYR